MVAPAVAEPGRPGIDLEALAARASTLGERVAGTVEVRPDPERSDRRLRRWSQVVARGDGDRFAARLALEGLDEDSARAVLGEAVWRGPLPPWTEMVAAGLRHLGDDDLDADRCLPQSGEPAVPLQELVVCFVRAARARLEDRISQPGALAGGQPGALVGGQAGGLAGGSADELARPSVLASLERELLWDLSSLVAMVGEVELRLWRRPRLDPLAEALARAGGDPGHALYDEWVRELRSGGLTSILTRYAALARLIGVMTLGWVTATAELLRHLGEDRAALAAAFGYSDVGALAAVGGADSDPHRERRRVIACRFESGLQVVYKPKSLRTEAVYGQLLEWLNARGAEPPLQPVWVLDRGDHGWAEQVQHHAATDARQVARYYRRAGMLLALLYCVGGNDCHRENLIAAGEHPQIVDAETVLHPILLAPEALGERWNAVRSAAELASSSVLGIGLLPMWTFRPDGRALDISGLGATEEQEVLDELPGWEHANTDVARLVMDRPTVPTAENVCLLEGEAQLPELHVEELSEGFAQGYRIIRQGRGDLLAPGGLVDDLKQAAVRVIFRSTSVYGRVLLAAQRHQHLREGVDRSIELELLGRPILEGQMPAAFWQVYRSEQAQLEATDVPRFEVRGADDGWTEGSVRLGFGASATEAAGRRLRALSAEDLRLQLALLRTSLGPIPDPQATVARPKSDRTLPSPDGSAAPPPDGPLGGSAVGAMGGLSEGSLDDRSARLIEAAEALAVELERTAIRSGAGVAWVGLSLGDEAQRWVLRATGFDFYSGVPGIALFLAGLARATGQRRWRQLSLAALLAVLEASEREPESLAVSLGVGGGGGLGGLVYPLVLISELLGEERPLAAARRLVHATPISAVGASRNVDLLGGAVGAACALCSLHRVAGHDAHAFELAAAAAQVLVGRAIEIDGGPMWEGVFAARPLDGFAHGTAGTALALARLGALLDDAECNQLAARAVAGESARFDPEIGGWPDRRQSTRWAMGGWCHGSAGIGLSRLVLRETPAASLASAALEQDLGRARQVALHEPIPTDQLCCGVGGQCELLLELAGRCQDGEAGAVAGARLAAVAERVLAGDGPRLHRPASGSEHLVPLPGLFQGTSGVGWSLLRGAGAALPSLLSWC